MHIKQLDKDLKKMLIKTYHCENCNYTWKSRWNPYIFCPQCNSIRILYKNYYVWEFVRDLK